MIMKDKEVLVTGYGFIGQHLVDKLYNEGAKLTVIEKNLDKIHKLKSEGVRIIKGDLCYLQENMEFDYVFHTAGITQVAYAENNYVETYNNNVLATLNLLRHVKTRKRFVFASTAAVYNNAAGKHSETEEVKPLSLYGLSKVAGEQLVKHYVKAANGEYTLLRFFNVYGDGQSEYFLIPQIVSEATMSKKITLWNTTSERDYIYVKDLVDGLISLGTEAKAADEIVNMGTGIGTPSGAIADTISKLMDCNIAITDLQKFDKSSPASLVADTTKAEALGFKARTTLEEGLRNIINGNRQGSHALG